MSLDSPPESVTPELLPKDIRWVELTSFLERKSARFREWWSSHEVASSLDWQKELVHPVAGMLYVNSVHFEFPRPSTLKMVAYTAAPSTDTAKRIKRLLKLRHAEMLRGLHAEAQLRPNKSSSAGHESVWPRDQRAIPMTAGGTHVLPAKRNSLTGNTYVRIVLL
jgi:MmyB-like transcription regulator ligand binding domain